MSTTTTYEITEGQAYALTQLSRAEVGLRKAVSDLQQRLTDMDERLKANQHLAGFDSDILGQAGREVQHYASRRQAFLDASLGVPEAVLYQALTPATSGFGGERFYTEGTVEV